MVANSSIGSSRCENFSVGSSGCEKLLGVKIDSKIISDDHIILKMYARMLTKN